MLERRGTKLMSENEAFFAEYFGRGGDLRSQVVRAVPGRFDVLEELPPRREVFAADLLVFRHCGERA